MTLDGFLAVLALAAAIYAVLSPVQRLRVSLSWLPQAIIAVPALLAILEYELFDLQPPGCPTILGDTCRYLALGAADPGPARKFAFIIAFFWLVAAVFVHRVAGPSLSSLPRFTQIAMALIDEEQYGDALKLIEPQIGLIARASRRRCWRQRLHDWLEMFGPTPPNSFARFTRRPEDRRFCGESWPDWAARLVRALAHLIPSNGRGEHAASDLLQLLMNSPPLLTYIAMRRPYFALSLFREEIFGGPDFFERYLGVLVRTPGSAFYQELATNDGMDGMVGYQLPERNRLLHFLFADARVAERLSAWKPVGDYLERLLDDEERPDYWAWLNDDASWFEREQLSDPTFMGMFFFDVMVTAAARQGVKYHMWLYYFPHIADRLERGYDSGGEGIDQDAEFPTRSARLLYELVQDMTSWVEMFARLPEGSPHREFPARFDSPGTIPHAAALALGRVLATVVGSTRIDQGVIQTLHDVTIRTIRDFHEDGAELSRMRRYLIDALLRGDNRPNVAHLVELTRVLANTDYFLRDEVSDYGEALQARLAAARAAQD
ncbi:hypothetical protein [Sphingobium yanoikuyae]|uniref:hypothetical protein n=1 Tax=Sphingobium yanoikuyae TaxID=13690 RepID=UPI000262B5AB|nr:hypothetical protein [Sphingobium yanoikuyae]